MVEEKFSPDMLDTIIDASDLASGGSYTSVGTYDHSEIVTLVTALSKETNISTTDLIHTFCGHLFTRFTQMYPMFFDGQETAFDFLAKVDGYIHIEVKKLYPDAELPRITCDQKSEQTMELMYHSSRHLGDVAEGLIRGCITHFGESISVARKDLTNGGDAKIQFTLSKAA